MTRQVATGLILLISLALLPACHRQPTYFQPSLPVVHEQQAAKAPAENVYGLVASTTNHAQIANDPELAAAHNTNQPEQSVLVHKRTFQIQKLLMEAKQQPASIARQLHPQEQSLSTGNSRKGKHYPTGMGTSGVGSLLFIGGIVILLLGLGAKSDFLIGLGFLSVLIGSIVSLVGRVTGR
ncbi:SdpI family protein [Spirosoma radiotolerans]|nr:SdpI family protein [Spirosoma radiotolerans]